ncbi:MAG: hypothetical protein KIT25_02915 [Enhydrobacter sp.]|nr:MAG: hypothetical protein KIT25_02915 [Enhydrobacter sp.]
MTLDGILRRVSGPFRRIEDWDVVAEPEAFRRGIFAGHISSRVLPFLPAGAAKFTLLREPVDHAVSLYAWARALRDDITHMARGGDAVRLVEAAHDLSFMEFTTSDDGLLCSYMRNPQTRIFACGNDHLPLERMGPDLLEAAKRVLEDFEFVGVTSRFGRSLECIGQRFLSGTIGKFHSAHRIKMVVEKDDEAIRRINHLDSQLYDWALDCFDDSPIAVSGKAR